MFLVYDTQMLIGGRKYELTEEEYVFGALTIYIDVIQIFLYLLSILGNEWSSWDGVEVLNVILVYICFFNDLIVQHQFNS